MAYKQKQSSCAKMVDAKGKPSGLMMAGSAYHMESISQEKKNLVNDMPIDGEASAMEMSPYKMDHGSPAKETDPSPERQARLDKMKAEREATQAIKRKEYDVKRAAIQEKRMEKTISRDKALNKKRAAIIEKRKQKDPSYKHHQKKQIVTSQQHLQVGTTPLEMHGPGGTHPDPKDGNKTTMDFNVGSGNVEGKGGRRKEFGKAFATARKAGLKEFTYNVGEEPKKKYTTKLKGEK